MNRAPLLAFLVAAGACHGGAAPAPSTPPPAKAPPEAGIGAWANGRRAAHDACVANDFAACAARLEDLYELSGSARILLEIARAEARAGDRAAAIEHLRVYASAGLTADVDHDAALAPLANDPTFAPLARRLAANRAPVARASVVFALPRDELVTEGLAWDPASRTFRVSSVRKRKILSVDTRGVAREFVPRTDGVGALCGIASRGDALWVTMATMPPMLDYPAAGPHPQALLRYDLHQGALGERIDLTITDHDEHALTDVAIGPNGDVFASDSLSGAVYEVVAGSHSLTLLTGAGTFVSPQTPAPTSDGKRLFVPDYVRGIASVDLATHETRWLPHPREVATEGIDDLHLVGNTLVAIQNGTSPARIVRFKMDAAMTRIVSATVLEQEAPGLGEPTHGVIVDGALWFLANAGWNRFGDDGSPLADAPPDAPAMMRLPL